MSHAIRQLTCHKHSYEQILQSMIRLSESNLFAYISIKRLITGYQTLKAIILGAFFLDKSKYDPFLFTGHYILLCCMLS